MTNDIFNILSELNNLLKIGIKPDRIGITLAESVAPFAAFGIWIIPFFKSTSDQRNLNSSEGPILGPRYVPNKIIR